MVTLAALASRFSTAGGDGLGLLTEEFPEETNAAHSRAEPAAETWATGLFFVFF